MKTFNLITAIMCFAYAIVLIVCCFKNAIFAFYALGCIVLGVLSLRELIDEIKNS